MSNVKRYLVIAYIVCVFTTLTVNLAPVPDLEEEKYHGTTKAANVAAEAATSTITMHAVTSGTPISTKATPGTHGSTPHASTPHASTPQITTTKAPTHETTTSKAAHSTTNKLGTTSGTRHVSTPVINPSAGPVVTQHFDTASFIGGIVLCGGLIAITFFGYKFFKSRSDSAYNQM